MIIVCIDNVLPIKESYWMGSGFAPGLLLSLTINKSYEIVDIVPHYSDNRYWVRNDKDRITSFPKTCFITLDEFRNLQIDKII